MSDQKLKVEIQTISTGNGAAESASNLERVNNAAKHAGEGSKEIKGLGETIAAFGSKTNPAREAIEGLEHASRGGIASFFQLAKSLKGVIEIGSAGSPFGVLLTALAALAGAALVLKEKFFAPAEEGFKDTAKAASVAAEKITAVEKAELKFEKQKQELDSLKQKFDESRAAADALFKAQERQRDAQLGLKIGQIDAAEQSALGSVGGDENRKKEIGLRAEAQRTLARSDAEREKIAAETLKAERDLAEIQKQKAAEAEARKKIIDTKEKELEEIADAKKKAALGNVKSDQGKELSELDRLRGEEAKFQKEQEEIRKVNPQFAAARESRTNFNVFGGDVADEVAKRRARIQELEKEAPALNDTIGSGKETFAESAKTAQEELKKAQEAFEKEASPENSNLLRLAKARSEAAEELSKISGKEVEIRKQIDAEKSALKAATAKYDDQITAAQAEIKATKIESTTASLKRSADLGKIRNTVADDNRKNAPSASDLEKEAQRQSSLRDIDDKLARTYSESDEGKKLIADRAKLVAQAPASRPEGIAVPELATTEKPVSTKAEVALSLPRRKGQNTINGVTVGPDSKVATINGEPVQPLSNKGKGITVGDTAPDGGAAAAVNKAIPAIESVKQNVPKAIPPDALSGPLAALGVSFGKTSQASIVAIQALHETQRALSQKQDELTSQLETLASQIKNSRS